MASGIKATLTKAALKQALKIMDAGPEEALPKMIDWADRLDVGNRYPNYRKSLRGIIEDKDNNWHKFIVGLWDTWDKDCRNKFFENFLINSAYIGLTEEEENRQKYNCNVPWAILMDPTSACNLHCTGCWAAEYGNKLNMSYETLDDIINQGKALGTYMYIYSGGEPLVRKDDLIKLCDAHQDCMFLSFTNATLIDEAFADEMLRVKNFIPAISIEGFEEATDFRRGQGTYEKCIEAMKILQDRKLAFGISCCYTSKNTEVIGSDEYIDDMIARGALFAWFFTYVPIGHGAVTDLIASPEQREFMYHQIRKWRKTKPLFTLDFWNDGDYVNGCIAGGRRYLHINANGDIEPCAFAHYSDSNIYEKTLLEAYQSPMFMQYRENQPFSDNLYRPCPALDNPGALAEMVSKTDAKSTDLTSPESAEEYCARCTPAANAWKPVADRLWEARNEAVARGEKPE